MKTRSVSMGRATQFTKVGKIGATLLLLAFVFNSGYAYTVVDDSPALAILLLGFVYLVCKNASPTIKNSPVLNRASLPFLVLLIGMCLSMIASGDFVSWGSYFHGAILLLFCILFARIVGFKDYAYAYKHVMNGIAVIAVIVWLIVNLAGITPAFPTISSATQTYCNGVVVFVSLLQPNKLIGVFWEPGVFSSMAVINVLLTGFVAPDKGKYSLTYPLMALAIALSGSTAGYILLGTSLLLLPLRKMRGRSKVMCSIALLMLFVLLWLNYETIVAYLANTFPDVFGKLQGVSYSRSTRVYGPIVDIELFSTAPLFGLGMGDYIREWPLYAFHYEVESRTSTITYFIANYGVLGIAYFVSIVRGCVFNKRFGKLEGLFIALIIIAIVSKEPHYFNLASLMFIFYLNTDCEHLNDSSFLDREREIDG